MTISVKAPLAVLAAAVAFAAVGAGSALAADPPKSAKMSDKAMKAMEAKAMKAKEAKAMKAKEMADKAMKAREAKAMKAKEMADKAMKAKEAEGK